MTTAKHSTTHIHRRLPIEYPLDRLEELNACWQALADLMNPEPDLASVDRDKLAVLAAFLASEQAAALAALQGLEAREPGRGAS